MKKMMLILTILFSVSSYCQVSLRGHVFDNFTDAPVGSAKIHILNSTISGLSGENGFFNIVDIPKNALRENAVEILITKDGYEPETVVQAITTENISISLNPKENRIDTWYKRLKDSEKANPKIIQVIGNFASQHIDFKNHVEDVLLEIQTGYGGNFSDEEKDVAKECLSLIANNQGCDKAIENVKNRREKEQDLELAAAENESEKKNIALSHLMAEMLYSIRLTDDFALPIALEILNAISPTYMIVRAVSDPKSKLAVGDIIIKIEDSDVHSREDWDAAIEKYANYEEINIQVRRNGIEIENLIVNPKHLKVSIGEADEHEIKWEED